MRTLQRFGNIAVLAVWIALAALLSGCVPSMSGISGSSLARTRYPRLTISANPPLAMQAYGRQWVSLPSTYLGTEPTGEMDYIVYGDGGEGPVIRHAHALVVRPSNDMAWYFQPESSKGPGALAMGNAEVNGYRWTTQILRVDGETDWFSAMWRESGREVPALWIARRFSATPQRATRVVAEYREPWPECLDPEAKDLVFVRKSCLEGFLERSDAAFLLDMQAPETIEAPSGPSVLAKPPFQPDMKKLAGELREEDYSFWRRW